HLLGAAVRTARCGGLRGPAGQPQLHPPAARAPKTDRRDCQWIYRLHSVGLLAAAFRPDEQTCRLRAYLRQRANLVRSASRYVQHMQKALEQMNLKLTEV